MPQVIQDGAEVCGVPVNKVGSRLVLCEQIKSRHVRGDSCCGFEVVLIDTKAKHVCGGHFFTVSEEDNIVLICT